MSKSARKVKKLNYFSILFLVLLILLPVFSFDGRPTVQAAADLSCRPFPETGFEVCGLFRQYWEANGGLERFGLPLSPEFDELQPPPGGDGWVHKVQYFERARLELHSYYSQTPFALQLGLLGREQLQAKYADKLPPPDPTFVEGNDCRFFSETNFKTCGRFLEYWDANGDLTQFGFPISPVFEERNAPPPAGDGQTYQVQYFERARFEYHPQNKAPNDIQLGLLGAEQYQTRYNSKVPPVITLVNLFPELANLADEVTKFGLQNDWSGLSTIAPIVAHYWLERKNSNFSGAVVFQAGGYSGTTLEVTRDVTIPLTQVQKFLRTLIQSPLLEGKYQPEIFHTDDYPSLLFAIETKAGTLNIFSGSQGANYVPWGASFNGRSFVINSDVPAQALNFLEPYLEKAAQKALIDRVGKQPKSDPPDLPLPGLYPPKPSPLQNKFSVLAEPGHLSSAYAVAFKPDGTTFATGGGDGTIRFWDTSGNLLKVLTLPRGEITAIAFSPDGKSLASEAPDNTIYLWDVASGAVSLKFPKQEDSIGKLIFTPDGKKLISGQLFRPNIRVWDTATGQELQNFKGISPALAPDGKTLAFISGFGDEGLTLVDLTSGATRVLLDKTSERILGPLSFSPDGKSLAVGLRGDPRKEEGVISLVDLSSETVRATLKSKGFITKTLEFSLDSTVLASIGFGSTEIQFWQVASGQLQASVKSQERFGLGNDLSFSPDGKTFVTIGGTIQVWDTSQALVGATKPLRFSIGQNNNKINGIAVTPDGQTVATATESGTVLLRNAADGKTVATFRLDNSNQSGFVVNSVAISPDGKILAAGGNSGQVRLWELNSRQEITTIKADAKNVWALTFSGDSRRLVSSGVDRAVKLWEVPSGKNVATFRGKVPEFYEFMAIAISPDGKRIAAAGSGDNETRRYPIKLWDVASGQELPNLIGHTMPLHGLSFSPDGKLLASSGEDQSVRLWDYAAGKQLFSMPVDTQTVTGEVVKKEQNWPPYYYGNVRTGTTSLSFSPDGKLLATAHPAGYIRLWEVKSGQELATTEVQAITGAFYLAFSLDGKTIFSGHKDSTLKRWALP